MVLIFDLDDTLYPEGTYVQSGFRAVAASLKDRFGWDSDASVVVMNEVLASQGRGAVFDALLRKKGVLTKQLVGDCVRIYRHHLPSINLPPEAAKVLDAWSEPLYLVTDGHKIAQHNKVLALGLQARFKKLFITHRYGINKAKPSTYCFERIRTLENCSWEEMVYVGDNPKKDFVNLNPLGCTTIRVLTGEYCNIKADPGHEAQHRIKNLTELLPLLRNLTIAKFGVDN